LIFGTSDSICLILKLKRTGVIFQKDYWLFSWRYNKSRFLWRFNPWKSFNRWIISTEHLGVWFTSNSSILYKSNYSRCQRSYLSFSNLILFNVHETVRIFWALSRLRRRYEIIWWTLVFFEILSWWDASLKLFDLLIILKRNWLFSVFKCIKCIYNMNIAKKIFFVTHVYLIWSFI
jgi:hypothetical protein